jgi:hypothetical protein
MSQFKVGLLQELPGEHGDATRAALIDALGGVPATEPEEDGTFEVTVEADSDDDALLAVWNAMAASGADEHIVFTEHPKLREHWRRASG